MYCVLENTGHKIYIAYNTLLAYMSLLVSTKLTIISDSLFNESSWPVDGGHAPSIVKEHDDS